MVRLVKQGTGNLWHVEGRGECAWAHLVQMQDEMGHIILGADQWSYAAVVARAANRQLTRADMRILFGTNITEEWYNESFRWLVENAMGASKHRNLEERGASMQ